MDKCYFCKEKLDCSSSVWSTCNRHFTIDKVEEVYHFNSGIINFFFNYENKNYQITIVNNYLHIDNVSLTRAPLLTLSLDKLGDLSISKSLSLLKKVLNNKAFI